MSHEPNLNPFEQRLRSIRPSEGKSDPMQIMFLAGQKSAAHSRMIPSQRRAGGWKLATCILSVACLILCLKTINDSTSSNQRAKLTKVPTAQKKEPSQPNRDHSVLTHSPSQPQFDLERPESWGLMGLRSRQLSTAILPPTVSATQSTDETLNPFSRHHHEFRHVN